MDDHEDDPNHRDDAYVDDDDNDDDDDDDGRGGEEGEDEDEDAGGDELLGDDGIFSVQCPYCFEIVELWLEHDVAGRLVQDCEVCCNPWAISVWRNDDGGRSVDVDRAQ